MGDEYLRAGLIMLMRGDLSLTLSLTLPPSFPLTLPSPIKGAKGRLLTHTYQHKPSLSLSLSLSFARSPSFHLIPPLGPAWACLAPISTA